MRPPNENLPAKILKASKKEFSASGQRPSRFQLCVLRYLILDFAYAMTTNSQAILYTITVCVTVILFFSFSGLIIFKKKSL